MKTTFIFLIVSLLGSPFGFAESCRDCGEITSLKLKIEKDHGQLSDDEHVALIEKMAAAIAKIQKTDEHFDESQMKLIVAVFRSVDDEGDRLVLLEDKPSIWADNRDGFARLLKAAGDPDALQILRDMESIVASLKYGQSPPPQILPQQHE